MLYNVRMNITCADPGIFQGGGGGGGWGPGQSDKKSSDNVFFFFFFFVLSLFFRFQRKLSFFKVPGGSNFFQGGGVQLLIPYRNPYNL